MQLQEPKCSITAMWAAGGRYAVGGNDGLSSWGFITSEGPRGSAPRCGALPNARRLAGDGAPPQVPGEPVVQSPGENRGAPFLLGIQNQPVHLLLGEFLCRYAEVVDLPFPTIGRRNAVGFRGRRICGWPRELLLAIIRRPPAKLVSNHPRDLGTQVRDGFLKKQAAPPWLSRA